jgi:hypothetical protein
MIVTLTVKDQLDNLVEGAKAKVFLDGDLVVEATTDASGEAEVELDEDDYLVRVSCPTTPYVAPVPYTMAVDADTLTHTLRVEVLSLPSAENVHYCRVSGTILGDGGGPSMKVVLQRRSPQTVISASTQLLMLKTPYVVEVSSGYTLFDLPRRGRYMLDIIGNSQSWWFEVPDLSAADLGAVLFPLVKTITPDSAAVALAAGDSEDVEYSQLYYSGLSLSSAQLQVDSGPERQFDETYGQPSMLFSSSDEDVATVVDDNGVLTITAVSAGVATISAVLQDPWLSLIAPLDDVEYTDIIEVTVT